ncbi:MAG: DUF4846 domain-containing protein, partial [Bergeyella zoohelcum]|nr:DUF4846 domain-containing protein [Bergeyella zoohelcum]
MQVFRKIIIVFVGFLSFYALSQVQEITRDLSTNPAKSTIMTRFSPPKGYIWEMYPADSFEEYLVNFPLKPNGLPVRDYRKIPIEKQYHHAAILDIDVGDKDLQQCADAWIRLYAEYLWKRKRYDEIVFEFTSQQKLSWNDYKNGIRTREIENGERVIFQKTETYQDDYKAFREYLNLVFRYAGTISLDRESHSILKTNEIKVGDFIITPGSPGHTVFVVGSAKNHLGKRIFLLAQGFMPAQDVQIIKNPNN